MRCPDEFALAADSWGVLPWGEPGPATKGLVMVDGKGGSALRSLVAAEVAELNKTYGLPEWPARGNLCRG